MATNQKERSLIRALYAHNKSTFGAARWDLIEPLFPDVNPNTMRRFAQYGEVDDLDTEFDIPDSARREIERLYRSGFTAEHLYEAFRHVDPDVIDAIIDDIDDVVDGEKVSASEEDNYLDVEITEANNVRNIDHLIREAGVDLETWRCESHDVNTWPTTAKNKHTQQLISRRNWQVKGKFIRLEPQPVLPQVQPVQINVDLPAPVGNATKGMQTTLLLTDPQFGFRKDVHTGELEAFHDRAALDVALQIAEAMQPDRIIWVGDMEDLPEWTTRFLKSPEFYWTTQPAIMETVWWLTQFRLVCPATEIKILEGNHDKRLEDALVTHLPAAYNLRPPSEMHLPPAMSIPRLLDLEKLHIEYVPDYPNGIVWLNEVCAVVHGDVARAEPSATVGKVVKDNDVTIIQGHIHRIEWASRTIHSPRGRRIVYAFSPGCLCRIDGVVPGKKARQNWQQGIGVVYHDDAVELSPLPIPIRNGKAIYNGALYEARDRLGDIRRDTDWEF